MGGLFEGKRYNQGIRAMVYLRGLRVSGLLVLLAALLHSAEPDALAIDAIIQARHVPYGTILNPLYSADNTQIANYTRCGDSALWTGHYLAAEAFRFAVTGSAEAFANLQAALNGLKLLVDVTTINLLARCAIPADSPYAAGIKSEEAANGIYAITLNGRTWWWVANTSRDQYSGVFFGLGAAYDLVPDPGVRASISSLATRLLNRLIQYSWNVVMPDGSVNTTFSIRPDEELALLQVGAHVNPQQFAPAYAQQSGNLAFLVPIPLGVDAANDQSSYFKFNLAFISLYNLIRLERDAGNRSWYEQGFAEVRGTTNNHLNAHFNMIDRALHGPDTARDAETRADLDAWLQRPRRDFFVNLQGTIPSCGNPNEACHPIPVAQRPPSDFLWQLDPFQLSGGGNGFIETAGIDYILPYWMARYYHVVKGPAPPRGPSGGRGK
jgi:hypothetical protein